MKCFANSKDVVDALQGSIGEALEDPGLFYCLRGCEVPTTLRSPQFNIEKAVAPPIAHCTIHFAEMNVPPPPPPQWVLDLSSPPAPKQKNSGIPDPPGFPATASGSKVCFAVPSIAIC